MDMLSDISGAIWHYFVVAKALNDSDDNNSKPESSSTSDSELATQINKSIMKLYGEFINEEGKYEMMTSLTRSTGTAVDYKAMGQSESFQRFQEDTKKLHHVNIANLSEDEKKAFFLNIYNALVIHGYVVNGVPTPQKRMNFYQTTAYRIGGHLFSLDDIEHGILRGNRKHPAFFIPTCFKDNDPRKAFSMQQVDPRIHFALVCGAKSCPPIRIYTPQNIEKGLKLAATNFCNSDNNFKIDVDNHKVYLSQIFEWYGKDFGNNHQELLTTLIPYLSEDKQTLLQQMCEGNVTVSFLKYDWSLNEKSE